jgi:DNA-binding transcriptional ArsR family regulator
MKDMNDIILNPVRMRIMQVSALSETITASEICEKMTDIPRTTVYRHIKILVENNVLSVVSETKIRGSLERTLSLNINEISKRNTIENATQNALAFLMNRYARFDKYFNSENPNPTKDRIFLNSSILMTTDEEFDAFLTELKQLLQKYSFEYADNRKARDLSIISVPNEK